MDRIYIESYHYDKGPYTRTIYQKREYSNGRNRYEIIIKNNNDKKVSVYESYDKGPFQYKKNYNNKQNSFINSYKDSNGSYNIIYSKQNPYVYKERKNQSVPSKVIKKYNYNDYNDYDNYNNYKKVAISPININNNYNQKTSPNLEYIRYSPKKENTYKFTKDINRKPIHRDKIKRPIKIDVGKPISIDKNRKSIKEDYLKQFINKDNNRKSSNKNYKNKSINKKDFDNRSFINKQLYNRADQKRNDKKHNYNNNSAINIDHRKEPFYNNKNNQKSSALNINPTKKDPLFDINNNKYNNHNNHKSQVGSNFYQRNPNKQFDIDSLLSQKRNMNNNFIRKKESGNQNKGRKPIRREPTNKAKRSHKANAHHSAPKYESSSSPSYDNFCNEALQAHNNYRKKHHVEPLKLNKELCKIAQNYADHLANIGRLQHSDNTYHNKSMGENIYYCSGKEATGSSVTASWYSEVKNYNYSGNYSDGIGHFTQVVWKETKEVGFGISKGQSGKIFAVANYYPAGNIIGYFKENVLRP